MARVDLILTVTPNRAGAERTLESVMSQSLRDWRLLVCAEPGIPGARAVFDCGDERVVFQESSRAGVAALRNEALPGVTATSVMFLEAGDRLDPAGLAHLVAAAEGGAHGVACGSWLVVGADGLADGPALRPAEGSIGLSTMADLLAVPPAAALVRSSLLTGKRFGANLARWSHTDLWLRLCEDGVRWQVSPAEVASVPEDPAGASTQWFHLDELRSVIERSFRRASAKGWDDERLGESHETEAVRSALFGLATRAALSGESSEASRAAEAFARVAAERCLKPPVLAAAAAAGLRYSAAYPARIDGSAERQWARPVQEWWSRCVTQKWVARHELDEAVRLLAELLVDPREVARRLLDAFGGPGRVWIGGTDRAARAVIGVALESGWRVLVLPGRSSRGVNQKLMALPSRVMVASANEGIGTSDPLVIGSADEAELLERYGARPNVARWNGAWRVSYEQSLRRLESAWPRREA